MQNLEVINATLKTWHLFLETKNPELLDELLADDVVFHSPVVWTPQEGLWITKLYLMAAMEVLGAENSGFTYVKEVIGNRTCVLEFTTTIDDITINGIDMIDINDAGQIVSFKVMIRPLKAINKVHEKMGELLAKYKP
jgi:hypothetical protein